jgi:hypothetical protein
MSRIKPIHLQATRGRNSIILIQRQLKVAFENLIENHERWADSVLYDSSHGHGMIATNGGGLYIFSFNYEEARLT